MRMAVILAGMPDLRRRFLAEHAPDRIGRCQECRNGSSPATEWPCLPYRIALEAQQIAEGAVPAQASVKASSAAPRVPLQLVPHSAPAESRPRPVETAGARRLKAVPAASWQPRW
jgi:hypothetical protein